MIAELSACAGSIKQVKDLYLSVGLVYFAGSEKPNTMTQDCRNMLKPNQTSTLLLTGLLSVLLVLPLAAQARTVIIGTPLGDIEIELLENDAPQTVANFLNYIDNNRYDNAFIHRSVDGFIIQGGGYTFADNTATEVPTFAPVPNEFKISNTRGTVAMAKLGNQPDSATSQWFINLGDNSANLDSQNGGFTVFARVIGDGMAVADAINQLPTTNAGGPFTDMPVINFNGTGDLTTDNLVMTAVAEQVVVAPFQMNPGLNDAWYNPATDGQGFFITVFPDLNIVLLAWFTYDTTLPAQGAMANLGDAGHRWLTAVGPINGDSAVLEIEIASGGLFDDPAMVGRQVDGSITLTFTSCTSGTVEYNIPSINRQGNVPIERVAKDNATLCDALQ